MGYGDLGKKAYREWLSLSGYTITKSKFLEMSEDDKIEFVVGFYAERSKSMSSDTGQKVAFKEFEKHLLKQAQ